MIPRLVTGGQGVRALGIEALQLPCLVIVFPAGHCSGDWEPRGELAGPCKKSAAIFGG